MATTQYATTSETTNAGRASRVLLGPCSDQLRDLLRHHVPPSTFSHVIHQHKRKLPKLTKPQLDLIYPQSGPYTGDYSDFDISLLYTLLRNLCNIPKHNKGWGDDPDPHDMSLSANIERIRICRNKLGHALEFALSNSDFIDIWSCIRLAVVEIDNFLKNNQMYEKQVDFLRYAPMDSEMANYFEEDLRKQSTEIKSLLSEHIKCSDQKLDDIRSNQEMIVKRLETCTKAVIHDQQRRNTNMGETYTAQFNTNSVQPTNQFLGFLHWILTVFGIMRIFNFFWNTEALGKLEYTEITETSILLKWEPKKHTRGEDSAYFVEYETTQPDIKTERVEVKSCEYRLEKLRHSTEYRVQIKVKTDSGETEHTDKIIFETRRHTARGLSDLEIQAFERDLKKSEVRLRNVRLMAIGHQGVGKTTLLHRLRNLASNPSEAELSTIFPTKSIKTDLNYAVCTGNGSIICLGEEDICRRKLGMRLEEKDKPVKGESEHSNPKAGKDKQTFKKSSEYTHKSRHGDTSSKPEVDNGSLSRIENKTNESKTISNRNGTESTDIKKDTNRLSAKEVEQPKTDTVKSHSTVIDETNKGEVLSESESGSAQKDSKDIAKKPSDIDDDLARDLREVLKKAQIGTEDESFISYWDFAGEDAYHDTHVAFMSSDAVYLLLFNAAELVNEEYSGRQEEHLIFWLQNIASLRSTNESTPPVIVMGTHVDELNVEFKPEVKGKLEDKIRQIARDQGALSNLQDIFLKNLKTDKVRDVWETIQDSRKKQEHWNQKVPTKMQILEYILTLEKVRSYSSSKEKIQATWDKIGGGSGDEDDLNLYLKVLSNSGSILFLEHDKNVILDISWIIKRFSDIFSPDSRKSHSALSDLKDECRIDREIFFKQFMPKNEKEGNDALRVLLFLRLIVESNGYITVPAYLKEKNLDLTGMRHMVEQKKGNENIKMSKTLAVTFKRGETPLSTIFFNSILVVLINTFRKKLNSPTQRETCLTSIGKTLGILDDRQDYGLLYEMKKSTLKLIVFSRRSSGIRANILSDIISKINMVNYAYNKKPLDMTLEISEGYTVPFHSKKGKEQMEIWTSTCDNCGEWKDIAYQTGQDLTFIDDEGWLKGCEDVGGIVFECMKCFHNLKEHRQENELARIDTEIQVHDTQILYTRQQLDKHQSEHHEKIEKLQTDVKRHREEEEEKMAKSSRFETEVEEHGIQIQNISQRLNEHLSDVEPDVNILREKLIERNNEQTREIPLSQVTTDGDTLPIEHLFSTVVIRENIKENRKGKKSAQSEEQQEGKEVKSPEDMLTKDGKPVPRVFMLGEAAHNKTTYCKWFLKTWCNTQQPGMSGRPLNKWENTLSQSVDPSRADVTDMICQDILGSDPDLQATAKHVLSSKKNRCFIMMDGLDEWKPDQSVIDRLKYKGMPNIDNMSNCVIFTTMRPWMFSEDRE